MLSVCMITYNQEQYISEAIDSVLMQGRKFDLELVIGEDCSTDNTREICERYAGKYPDIIKLLPSKKNHGFLNNFIRTFKACSGKYVVQLAGDDYWIDDHKLQKQVDFLEANPGYSICFTDYIFKNEVHNEENTRHLLPGPITVEELLKENKYATATSVFRGEYFRPVPKWFGQMPFEDWPLYIYVVYKSGKNAYVLKDVTTVYRIHKNSVYSTLYFETASKIKAYRNDIKFYKLLQSNLFNNYDEIINNCIQEKKRNIADLLDKRKDPAAVINEINAVVSEEESLILVDEGILGAHGTMSGRKVVSFTEKEGIFNGLPADDSSAINEIERQVLKGVGYIVFTWTAFWYLDYYSGMFRYLQEHFECVIKNKRLIAFHLKPNSR